MARSWWKTALALALTAVMLFPIYWMVNVSFTHRESIRKSQLLPLDFTTDHYRGVLPAAALPHDEPARRCRHGGAHAARRRAGRLWSGEAARPRREGPQLRPHRRADDPGGRDVSWVLRDLQPDRDAGHHPRPDPRGLDARGALRGHALHRVHAGHPE